jgi:flavin-dependent dehydrogenase
MKEYDVAEDFILDRFGSENTSYFHLKPKNLYGYAWIFPKKKALNVGLGAFWKDIKRINIKQEFSDYFGILKKKGLIPENLIPQKPKGGQIPLRGAIEKSFSDRILLIGDAAGFVSPIGGDGIYYGMCSGMIASKVVNYAAEHDSFTKDTLKRYQDEWTLQWGEDLKSLCFFADKLFARTEQIIRYAGKDELLRKRCVELYTGECRASKMKLKFTSRMARDILLYDVLKRK